MDYSSSSVQPAFRALLGGVGFLIGLSACGAHDAKHAQPQAADSGTTPAANSAVASRSAGDIPVALPLAEQKPIGLRVGSVTIWLDSTRLDSATRALSPNATISRYSPYGNVHAACFHTQTPHETYITLAAGLSDSARVVDAIITTYPHAIAPPARCALLNVTYRDVSNSLGLRLGMSQSEIDGLLGAGDEGEYILGRPAGDTTLDEVARTSNKLVIATLDVKRDSLTSIRIHRGPMLPRNYE